MNNLTKPTLAHLLSRSNHKPHTKAHILYAYYITYTTYHFYITTTTTTTTTILLMLLLLLLLVLWLDIIIVIVCNQFNSILMYSIAQRLSVLSLQKIFMTFLFAKL